MPSKRIEDVDCEKSQVTKAKRFVGTNLLIFSHVGVGFLLLFCLALKWSNQSKGGVVACFGGENSVRKC